MFSHGICAIFLNYYTSRKNGVSVLAFAAFECRCLVLTMLASGLNTWAFLFRRINPHMNSYIFSASLHL